MSNEKRKKLNIFRIYKNRDIVFASIGFVAINPFERRKRGENVCREKNNTDIMFR